MEGRSTCLNCGTELPARWCPVCGQDGERRLHSLPTLLARTLESLSNFDGRVASTLRRLIAQPGRLTHEYAQGHFVGQVDPVRLYLAISALYFFVAPRIGGGFIRLAGTDSSGPWFSFGPLVLWWLPASLQHYSCVPEPRCLRPLCYWQGWSSSSSISCVHSG